MQERVSAASTPPAWQASSGPSGAQVPYRGTALEPSEGRRRTGEKPCPPSLQRWGSAPCRRPPQVGRPTGCSSPRPRETRGSGTHGAAGCAGSPVGPCQASTQMARCTGRPVQEVVPTAARCRPGGSSGGLGVSAPLPRPARQGPRPAGGAAHSGSGVGARRGSHGVRGCLCSCSVSPSRRFPAHPQVLPGRVGQPMSDGQADGGRRRKTGRSPSVPQCQNLPNKGLHLTAYSVRSCVAPASSSR